MKKLYTYSPLKGQELLLHLGALSRDNALFCLDMYKYFNVLLQDCLCEAQDTFPKKAPIALVLAVSGGVDSIAMLCMFLALQKKYPHALVVAHFNHGIRVESDAEEVFLKDLCAHFSMPFYTKKEDIPVFAKENKLGIEEASRVRRYLFLEEIRQKVKADYICVAHHAHDLAEDMLMRLCRGAAWPNVAGMPAKCDTRNLLRPLLFAKKQQLIDFLKEINVPFVEDISNDSQDFLRNRVRQDLLPFFIKENPQFLESIQNLHTCAHDDNMFFNMYLNDFIQHLESQPHTKNGCSTTVNIAEESTEKSIIENNINASYEDVVSTQKNGCSSEKISMPVSQIQTLPKAMRLRLYIRILSRFDRGFTSHNTLYHLDNALMQNNGNKLFKFTNKLRARIEHGVLSFFIS